MAESVKASDHPDFVGGIVWSDIELRWINAQLEQARREEREVLRPFNFETRIVDHDMLGSPITARMILELGDPRNEKGGS